MRGCLLGCFVIAALIVATFFAVPPVINVLRQEQQRSREINPSRPPPAVPAARESEPPRDFRRLRASVVEIIGVNESSRVNGFFVSRNEIVVPLSGLQAVLGSGRRARIESQSGLYVVERTTVVDRQHGLVILRVRMIDNSFGADPVLPPINDRETLASGQLVTILRSFRDNAGINNPTGTIGNRRGNFIEIISDELDPAAAGRPVLNERGEVVAIIARTRVGNNRTHLAVPAVHLVGLLQR